GLILCSAWWWAKWQNRLPLVLRLDLASSLILLALFWWTSQPRSSGQDYVGVVYVGAAVCKGAVLVFHAISNAPKEGQTKGGRAYVGLVFFLIYSALTPWVVAEVFATGDEPHYLLEAHSLLYDHDLDLSNNYVNGDSSYYYPGTIPDHHTVINSRGQELPFHDVGLPAILLPGVALSGRFGAVREMNLLAALLALCIYVLAGRFAPSGSAATLTWALFAFASPLVVFSSQIYPEVPGALLSTGAALSFEKYRDEG